METHDAPEPSLQALTAADQLAHGLVAAADPIHFEIAHSDQEREAAYRLRYQVVVERGWALAAEFPDGQEFDEYDQVATHIVGWAGSILAATARLVLPAEDRPLPTEAAFGLQVAPRGQVADMGRQIVAREYSSVRHKVFAALLARTWLEMRAHGYVLVCGDFSPTMMRLYRMLGFDVKQLGPAQKFWGEERAPILVDIAGSVPVLTERWGKS
jgi:N-acyl-L-homoserine lactone synthetase